MMTIIPAQIHSHEGIDSAGSNLMAQQATNDKSAMLSITDPVLLSAWSFLAICRYDSTILEGSRSLHLYGIFEGGKFAHYITKQEWLVRLTTSLF